jgi:CBS domain-containing protein
MITARDIMTEDIVTIKSEERISHAIALMRQHDISYLIVERESPAGTWGELSRTDIIKQVISEGKTPEEVRVQQIMHKPISYVFPDSSLKDIARVMRRDNVRCVIVFDGINIRGVVSASDVFRAFNDTK